MDEQDELYFLTALGEEFCGVLRPVASAGISPHDGYEVFSQVLGSDFQPASLEQLNDDQIEDLRKTASNWLESTAISPDHIREIVRRTILRWPSVE